jgi:hypothetical protein
LSAGTRFDYHSYYRPILSPRIAINKTLGRQYVKFSFNRSFRTPAIANIIYSLEDKILPQLTNYFDFEYGIKLSPHLHAGINLYQISVKDGIVYQIVNQNLDGYSNSGKQGTRGIEAQFSFRNEAGAVINGSWSAYSNTAANPGGNYFVPGKRINLAYPGHKFCLNAGFPINQKLRLNSTFLFLSNRYGFNGSASDPAFINYGSVFQFNLYVDYRNVYLKGLNLGFGIFDISNSGYSFIQPYKSHHLPVPAIGREFTFRVSYGLNPENR